MFSTIRENISPAIAAAAFVFIVGTILIALVMILTQRKAAAQPQ
jgi:putative spermidine/putrescine transport system permease protein